MGGADTTCNQVPFGYDGASIMLNCRAGGLNTLATEHGSDSLAFSAGIINADQQTSTYCSTEAFEDENNCSQYLDVDLIKADVSAHNG